MKLCLGFIPLLVFISSCTAPGTVDNGMPENIRFTLPPERETPVFQILEFQNQYLGTGITPWLYSYLQNGIVGPESMNVYQGNYLFIASMRSSRLPVINQWIENYSHEHNFSRLVAGRIQNRLHLEISGIPPEMVYGPNYARVVKAAYETRFWGSRRLAETWIFALTAGQNETMETEDINIPMYWGFILLAVPQETLEIQIVELISRASSAYREATREQNAAFGQVRENFFERF